MATSNAKIPFVSIPVLVAPLLEPSADGR